MLAKPLPDPLTLMLKRCALRLLLTGMENRFKLEGGEPSSRSDRDRHLVKVHDLGKKGETKGHANIGRAAR